MATVKIKFIRHVYDLVKYLLKEREPADPIVTHNCHEDSIYSDFQDIRKLHNGKGEVNAIHIMQNWSAGDSEKLSQDEFNRMGKELTEQHFPGHAFIVVTHTNTGKFHNHIVVSPWHSETGGKVENKKHHWHALCDKNDAICRTRGLETLQRGGKLRQKNLPDKVQKIARFKGYSWVLDTSSKADFARAYATSFDEYKGILSELGVRAHIEEKNITYFYGSHKRGTRGSKLGAVYDRPGLEKAFRENDAKFAAIPGLRDNISGVVAALSKGSMGHAEAAKVLGSLPGSTYQTGQKDYSRFTKVARPGRPQRYFHELDTTTSLIPIEELRRARNGSIFQYCRTNGIELLGTNGGKYSLKGRPFVEIDEFDWTNKRNRTRGSLIEFVAAHKNLSILEAVADINKNSRLLLLEQHLGKVERTYTSFYIPKENRPSARHSIDRIGKLLSSFGVGHRHASDIFNAGLAQVDDKGRVRLFGKGDGGGAFEFTEAGDGAWKRQKIGQFQKPFLELTNHHKKMVIYLDPFAFLKHQGKHALLGTKYNHDVLCLMEPDERIIDQHLAKSRHISEVQIFLGQDKGRSDARLDFFNNLKARAVKFGIELKHHPGHEKGREREADLPSL